MAMTVRDRAGVGNARPMGRSVTCRTAAVAMPLMLLAQAGVGGQSGLYGYADGQTIAPVFEGWERNPDGSANMVFGFYNRNCVEVLDIPIGPDNNLEPGGPDRGQPTRFFPRRGMFQFKVRVPPDFGDQEFVWTLTAYGHTERAYASLRPLYVIDKRVTMMNESGFGQQADEGDNLYPTLRVEGELERSVRVGEPLRLTAVARDDGLPVQRAGEVPSHLRAGLMVGWLVYRGDAAQVTFDPVQFNPDFRSRTGPFGPCGDTAVVTPPEDAMEPLPANGRVPVTVTFSRPGAYVLRVMAHDGALKVTREIAVNVNRR